MNSVFKLMVYSMLLNFSVGIMLIAIPAFDPAETRTSSEYTGGLIYNNTYAEQFTTRMNKTVTPGANVEDAGNQIYRILDMLNIGFITKFLNIVNQYMYGFINLLESVFGGYLGAELSSMIFSTLKVILSIGYLMGAWVLWTGRDLRQ